MINILDFSGLLLMLAGFILGLGAVTVIDLHGFLGRTSTYWTEATIRTHKITKPLIWAGIFLAIIGGILLYRHESFTGITAAHFVIALALVFNGLFLTFKVSPMLLQLEKDGKARQLLPKSMQQIIFVSFLISAIGWWTGLILLIIYLLNR